MLSEFLREQRELPWQPNLDKNMPKLHIFHFCARNGGFFAPTIEFSGMANSSMLSKLFQGANGVTMATTFKQKKQNWNNLGQNLGPRQTTFRICVQRTCLGSIHSLILNTLIWVLLWQQNFRKISKNCTDLLHWAIPDISSLNQHGYMNIT